MLVAILVASVVCVIRERRRDARGIGGRCDIPEELLARQMPSEYPAYKKLFEIQASAKLYIPTHHC